MVVVKQCSMKGMQLNSTANPVPSTGSFWTIALAIPFERAFLLLQSLRCCHPKLGLLVEYTPALHNAGDIKCPKASSVRFHQEILIPVPFSMITALFKWSPLY